MSLHPREVDFLRRLVSERRERRTLGPVAQALAKDHGIGTVRGAAVQYEERHFTAAEHLLRSRGYPLEAPPTGGSRSDSGPGGSEKTGARQVMADMVAVVPVHMEISVPAGARFLAANWRELDLASFDLVLECENLEPLYDLAAFGWLEGFIRGRRTMAVFRGMPGSFGTAAAAQFIAAAGKPVIGFYDFDPEGLAMAASEPRLEALCLPAWEDLQAATRRFQRTHLYRDQLQGRRVQLDALPHGPVRDAWNRLNALQCGLNQENFPK